MQNAVARHRRYGLRRATHILQRWLVLVLIVAVSGLLSVAGNGHVGHAAASSHEFASTDHGAGAAPCCPEHDSQPGTTIDCCGMSGCPLYAPIVASAILVLRNANPVEIRAEPVHLGRTPPPQLRPPKLIPNV